MPARRVDDFNHREFFVVVGKNDNGTFEAVGRDKDRKEIARVKADDQESVTSEIKIELNKKSSDFVDINGAINLFRKPFPLDFADPYFKHHEGDYKEKARQFVVSLMAQDVMDTAISEKRFDEVGTSAAKTLQKTNIASPFEVTKFRAFVANSKNHEPFAHALYDLLYGNNFDDALKVMAKLLASGEVAKWPVITYWPFFCHPDRHMYLKPEIVQIAAYRLGYELDYAPYPNPATYNSLLDLTDYIRNGIAELKPASNIDIQSFMYVVGKEGYIAEALEGREAWENSLGLG